MMRAFVGICLIFGTSSPRGGHEPGREQQREMGERGAGSRHGTWVRDPEPGSPRQNVPTCVRPCQVAVGGGVPREDIGHCQHVAEQPAQGQPQQHLPITVSRLVRAHLHRW